METTEHVVDGQTTRVLHNGVYKVAFLITGDVDRDAFAERCARMDLNMLATGTLGITRVHGSPRADSEGAGSHG